MSRIALHEQFHIDVVLGNFSRKVMSDKEIMRNHSIFKLKQEKTRNNMK